MAVKGSLRVIGTFIIMFLFSIVLTSCGGGGGNQGSTTENNAFVPTTQKVANINLPGVSNQPLKTVSVDEYPIDNNGQSNIEVPKNFYSFAYATDSNGNIVGMYYGNASDSTKPIDINIDSTAKSVVMSIPVDWGKYGLSIPDVFKKIENSPNYPTLKSQVKNIINSDPSNLISEKHIEIWNTAIQIIEDIIGNVSYQSALQTKNVLALSTSSSDPPPVFIEDIPGPEVLIKNGHAVPYGISSVNTDTGNYQDYSGTLKTPYWVPGKQWSDYLSSAMSIKYELGVGNFITCLSKFSLAHL